MATARALQLKEEGNKYFVAGDYAKAEALYSKALNIDTTNPQLYTNRAFARLKLELYESVIPDCEASLQLLEVNMKAYYYRAQAELGLGRKEAALASAEIAYELCSGVKVGHRRANPENVVGHDKGSEKSLGAVTALVLRCKKENWELKERERLRTKNRLLEEMVDLLNKSMNEELMHIQAQDLDKIEARELVEETQKAFVDKIEALRRIWDAAAGEEGKRREVPEWAIDDITFAVMNDPVMTKMGHSYERASITEHLRNTATDPLTRTPLTVDELRPNLGLRDACSEFLASNGWAVDW